MKLTTLMMDEDTLSALQNLRLPIYTVSSFLMRPTEQLADELHKSPEEIKALQAETARWSRPPPVGSTIDRKGEENFWLTGWGSVCSAVRENTRSGGTIPLGKWLDTTLLPSGLPVGMVTEIVGGAGTGKSQFSLMVAAVAAEAGLGVLYMDTGCDCSLSRLEEMLVKGNHGPLPDSHTQEALSNVYIVHPRDPYQVVANHGPYGGSIIASSSGRCLILIPAGA